MSSDNPWYKDAIFYELHVKAFFDGIEDGIGDFKGLSEKLDYLKDLGIDCIWLLPFFESPQKDDGYDISNYYKIQKEYGSLKDFKKFIREAHKRSIKVIADLILNHTSDQHPWFKESRSSKNSKKRDYYVWSDKDDKYKEAKIIFTDTETSNWAYDKNTGEYYWHRFFSHQPDLNYKNPKVKKAIIKIMKYWLDLGIDGFRCDAVPFLFEKEDTDCTNLPETHQFIKELRKIIDLEYKDKILLAEADLWPEDLVSYFNKGDEFHMAFHFPLMPRIFMALRQESSKPIIDILERTPKIPKNCQWVLFLRNHDELTLQMVTDKERDYMYKEYAKDHKMKLNIGIRRRLAPLMENKRKQIELLYSLLMTLPGSPIIYYGDEIGMGDNINLEDRNGVRTPMQWNSDRNAGFSKADSARLYSPVISDPIYGYKRVNVESQNKDPKSLLNWMKKIIKIRKKYSKVFGRGSFEILKPKNKKTFSYIRKYEDSIILIINNLSRFPQTVELDLSKYKNYKPIELVGQTDFSIINNNPYLFTLGPHNFYWFKLEKKE